MPQSASNIYDPALFECPFTFMGVPYGHDLSASRVAVLGIPFDVGTHPRRIGSRDGPQAIRDQSYRVRRYYPPYADVDVLTRLGVVDCGNVRLLPSYLDEAYASIEEAVWRIMAAETMPLTMGGDGSVTLPQLRAAHRHHLDLVVLHVDAHTDTRPGAGRAAATGTTFARAAKEGLVDPQGSIHLGIRGTVYTPGVLDFTRSLGYEVIEFTALREMGIEATIAHVQQRLAGRPVYLCWDMDFFDPAYAPGVCAPTWGGATAEEGLQLLQGLAGLNLVACDVNTVSPPHDTQGLTAHLAAQVMYECIVLVWRRESEVVRRD
jgi:agmatinase